MDWADSEGGAFRWKLASCQQQELGELVMSDPFLHILLSQEKRTLGRCLF